MRAFGILLILPGLLAADVVLLKDGSRVSGRVVDKSSHVEVTTDQGLRTWLKEEVEKILTSPAELLGDSDKLLEEAKADYDRISALPVGDQSAAAKAALAKVGRARTAVAAARELFPEERFADLDLKLMRIMQLTRLLRDRVGSAYARAGAGDVINGPAPMPVEEAVAIAIDAKRRSDAAQAEPARKTLLRLRAERPDLRELATAAAVVLSRPDWTSKALEEYFAKPWFRELDKVTPAIHLEAAAWAAERVAAIRKADPAGLVEPLALLGLGHLAHAPAGPEADQAARGFGLIAVNGMWGTPEGHAVRDLDGWIASGDFGLAALAFVKEHRAADSPATRYVWSYALLRLAQEKRKGFDRPVSALLGIKGTSAVVADHVTALIKSIKAAAVCGGCSGEGKLRCTNCFGRKEVRFNCEKCVGSGKVQPPGSNDGVRKRMAEPIPCYPCRGRGFTKLIKCEKCPDGSVDCKQCESPKDPPSMDDIAKAASCGTCEGRGTMFRSIAWACPACLGLGQKLAPKAEPAKILP